jgi:nitric oxide reductase subunit B
VTSTYLIGFCILVILTYPVYRQAPPIPEGVVTASGQIFFTYHDIDDGMSVFRRYGLMEYDTIYGHRAYLGPHFKAD